MLLFARHECARVRACASGTLAWARERVRRAYPLSLRSCDAAACKAQWITVVTAACSSLLELEPRLALFLSRVAERGCRLSEAASEFRAAEERRRRTVRIHCGRATQVVTGVSPRSKCTWRIDIASAAHFAATTRYYNLATVPIPAATATAGLAGGGRRCGTVQLFAS